jgi:hypothetical protein
MEAEGRISRFYCWTMAERPTVSEKNNRDGEEELGQVESS